ncbi:MAG: hypothetical protein SV760_01055, partial [Halobacteria archaeon]|nr:hypothetical protein [Halobacteria archaeon]
MKSKKKINAKARKATVVAGLLLALAAVAVVPAAAQSQNSTVAENGSVTDENASADVKFSFGQQISIIVSAKQAQVQASVENEAFEIAFDDDEGNRSQAVERRVEELRQRIEEMQQKKKELRQAYKNGNLSKTEFQARMASLS